MTLEHPNAEELASLDATEHTPVEQADTLPVYDPTVPPESLNIGDVIQASRGRGDDAEPTEVAEGIVVERNTRRVRLGSRDFLVADGWTFEVITANMSLPESLSEIDVQLHSLEGTHRLMGKGTIWTSGTDGRKVPVDDIKSFVVVD